MTNEAPTPGLSPPLQDGPWAGWSIWTGSEPFEEYAGPFYTRREPDGSYMCGFRPRPCNLNGAGIVHGGAIATFADYSLFMIAYDALQGQSAVTVTLNTEFVGAAFAEAVLTASGEVLRAGKSLMFVRGVIKSDATPVMNFSGVIKIIRTHRQS